MNGEMAVNGEDLKFIKNIDVSCSEVGLGVLQTELVNIHSPKACHLPFWMHSSVNSVKRQELS